MDEEMSFPNPVVRHDLPQRRPWKRYVLAGLALVGVLTLAFLPQVLHNRIGRRLLRARLEMKYNAEASIESFSTSWFGGTTAGQVWLKSSDGRVIGFNALRADGLSLGKLLRGKFDLGNCTVDGLIVDYSFDTGDANHPDTYEKMTGALPRSAATPPTPLARLSGKITLTNCRLNLYRCQIDPKTLNPIYQTVRFENINGNVDVPASLDKSFTWKVDGSVGVTGEERGQIFKTAGTLGLGEAGKFMPSAVRADATFEGQNVPTDLVAVLLPLMSGDDAKATLGSTFDQLAASLKGDAGLLKLDLSASGARAQAHLRPAFDLKGFPFLATLDSADNEITAGLPVSNNSPLRRALACINPFAMDAQAAPTASVVLRLSLMSLPIGKNWVDGTLKGELELRDAKLAPPPELASAERPRSLTRQLESLTAEPNPTPGLQSAPVAFALDAANITLSPATFKVGDAPVQLSGSCSVEGALKMKLGVTSPALASAVPQLAGKTPTLEVPLLGTADQPRLDVAGAARALGGEGGAKLTAWSAQQAAALRAREAETMLHEQEGKVRETLKPFSAEEK
jgi:hypothetical protein